MPSLSRDPIFVKIRQWLRSYKHIILYTAKICQNSVLGDRILFVLGW